MTGSLLFPRRCPICDEILDKGKLICDKCIRIPRRVTGERCFKCYELRMREAAIMAKEGGYDYFTTTLSISPLKNAEKINEIGEELEREYGVKHLPSDFKKREGYKHSIELSRKYDLYRQDYCGCVFSRRD